MHRGTGHLPLPLNSASSTAGAAAALSLYQIYIISPHLLLLRAILLLLLAGAAAATSVRECFLVDSEVSSFCAVLLLLLVLYTTKLLTERSFSLTLSHSLTWGSPLSQPRLTGVWVFEAARPDTQKYDGLSLALTQKHNSSCTHTSAKRGRMLLLVLAVPLVAPTDCFCCCSSSCCWSSSRFFFFCESAGTFWPRAAADGHPRTDSSTPSKVWFGSAKKDPHATDPN